MAKNMFQSNTCGKCKHFKCDSSSYGNLEEEYGYCDGVLVYGDDEACEDFKQMKRKKAAKQKFERRINKYDL